MTSRLRAGALAVLLAVVPTAAGAATSEPSDAPPAAVVAAPEEVASWFAEEGAEAVASAELGEPEQLAVGAPRPVAEWSEAYLAGENADPVAEPVAEWVAPVLRQSDEAPEPVGVVHAADDGGALSLVAVTGDALLAEALFTAPGAAVFVADGAVEGWFGVVDGEVWPASDGARTVLQGSLPTTVFQDFLAVWHGESAPTPPPAADEDDGAALSPLVPIGIIVLGAAAAWLLLRQYRRADSRIAADVRAGLEPPPEGEAGHHEEHEAAADR